MSSVKYYAKIELNTELNDRIREIVWYGMFQFLKFRTAYRNSADSYSLFDCGCIPSLITAILYSYSV